MFDVELKTWLIEVNASPSLSASSYDDKLLKKRMLTDTLNVLDLEQRLLGTETRVGGFDLLTCKFGKTPWSYFKKIIQQVPPVSLVVTIQIAKPSWIESIVRPPQNFKKKKSDDSWLISHEIFMTENRLPLISFNLALITILHYFYNNKFYFFKCSNYWVCCYGNWKISHFVKNL